MKRLLHFGAHLGAAVLLLLPLTISISEPLAAQGNQAGSVRGRVSLPDGSPVPGVQVTFESDALQGTRTAYSNENGEYIARGLAPGSYKLLFTLDGMATIESGAEVTLGQVTPVNIEMQVSSQSETIVVRGELPGVLASSQVSTTYSFDEVNNLPVFDRAPDDIALLAPGLNDNSPNANQLTISGAFAYDNVFLIDGVDANDNLFGSSGPVYIEDAIADVQVLTSGISAEYGRFSGGVINVITKSGGNRFEGTLRADLENDDWRAETPLEEAQGTELQDEISEIYQGTLGGYVMKDKIWFFAAGRDQSLSETDAFFVTGLPEPETEEEERVELKLTGNLADKHQFQAQYTDREQTETDSSFSFSATPDTLRARTDPSDLRVARYNGILTSTLFGELQASEKTFGFRYEHGVGADRTPGSASFIQNTPFFDFFGNSGAHYHAPYFDGTDPEDRDNEQFAGALSFFLDAPAAGTHDLKFGVEDFTSILRGGNSQSPTDFVMAADVAVDATGNVLLDAANRATPIWEPGNSGAWQWIANRSANVEINTLSYYVNDSWQLNEHWSFNLGARFETVDGESDAGITTVDSDALVPRLGASYDLRGDGKYRFDLTYAEYAGKYSEAQFAQNTDVGNPPGLLYIYTGAPGTGVDFAPAYDFNNELGSNYVIVSADDGTQNIVVDDGINSPKSVEWTLAGGMQLPRGGFLKGIYTRREYDDFVEDFVTTATGSTEVFVEGTSAGTFSNQFITNTDAAEREYEAIQLIGRHRLSDNWTIDGNWTWQLSNEGNFEGEATNQPGISSIIGDYPQILSPDRHFPIGDLVSFAEHRVRVWSTYSLDVGRAGTVTFGGIANFDTGRAFSSTDVLTGVTPEQQATLTQLGFADALASQRLFFDGRGDVEFEDALTFDLSVNYTLPVVRDLDLWIKTDIVNIFDDDSQVAGDTDVLGDFSGPLDELGLPTTFTAPDAYLSARDNDDFVDPREYRFTVGFRF